MKKMGLLRPPELPELPFPRTEELVERIETVVNKAIAVPVARIVSKVLTTPLMIVEKVTDGLREATILAKEPEEPETGEEEPEKVAQKEGGKEKNGEKE